MKSILKKVIGPLSNEKGMELITYMGLLALAVILGALVWTTTDASLDSQVSTIADKLSILFS